MGKIKILILEDNKLDAELIKEELTEHKFDFTSKLVETKKDFTNAIQDFKPDIILSDYNLPQFTGFEALEIAKKIVPDIPFIIVTGSLSEEIAADSIKRGAWDYVLKENLLRLTPAIENAFKLKVEKDKNKQAEEEIRKLSKVVETTPEAVVIADIQGNIEYVNQGLLTLGGFEDDSLIIGKPVFLFSNEAGVKQLKEIIIPTMLSEGKWRGEVSVKRKDSSLFPADMVCSLIMDEEDKPKYLLSQYQDITERKKMESELVRLSDAFSMSIDSIIISDLDGKITDVNEATLKMYSTYDKADLIGKNSFDIIAPEDKEKTVASVKEVMEKGYIQNQEYNIVIKDGSKIPVEMSTSIMKGKNSEPIGYVGITRDITERKQSESALKESEEKFAKAFHTNPAIIGLSNLATGKYTEVNQSFYDKLGFKKNEVIGKRASELVKIDFKFRDTTLKNLKKYGNIRNTEAIIYTKNGKPLNVLLSSDILELQGTKYNFTTALDITDRKKAEQIQKVLYNISNAVITTDNLKQLISLIQKELGTIIDTTNFYIALYDHKADMFSLPFFADKKDKVASFPARKTLTYYVIKTQKALLATKEKIKKLEKSGDIESFGTDSEIWLGVPLKIEGEITGVLAVQSYTDENAYDKSDMEMLEFVSDQISISINRKKAEDDLITALEKATESDRLKSAFLATMSHELRTPLNAIIGFSGLINEDLPIEEVHDFAHIINSSGSHLLNIVDDLFDITLIESGKTKIHNKEIDLISIMNDIHKIMKAEQQKLNKNNIDLNMIIPPESKDLIFITDSSKFKQILINLLKNALKFTYEGHIDYGFIIEDIQDKPMIKFYVSDTGIGISKDKHEFIFNLFRQIDDGYTRKYGGTGIGLSISKKLTKLLGGNIWLESEEGQGSTFYFTIPYDGIEMADKKTDTETVVKTENVNSLQKKTILIVEDDEDSYKFLKVVFEKSGISIIGAKDGEESIKQCKENPNIDLVLMDINMPIMNGYTATKEIKKFRPYLPIIAQTAYAIAGDREKAINVGCDDYISKPIKKAILMKVVGKWI